MTKWKEYRLETVPSTVTVPSTSSGTGEPPVIELVTGTEGTVVELVETTVSLVETTVSPVEGTKTDDTNKFP